MYELLAQARDGARVLDLGCRHGSFPPPARLRTVRVDLDPPSKHPNACAVQADATALPFAPGTFELVISNHSLEHIDRPEKALREIGRTLTSDGALYIAVPDASTLTDRIYRWMAQGGGHINAFTSAPQVAELVHHYTGLPCTGTRTLYSSLSFLHRRSQPQRPPRKLWLFLNGSETALRWFVGLLRLSDRVFGSRLSVYGWALYFGAATPPEQSEWPNVCVGCGSAHPAEALIAGDRVHRGLLWTLFDCPTCGSRSVFHAGPESHRQSVPV